MEAAQGLFRHVVPEAGRTFVAAFQSYESTDDFALKIEDCLRQWLAKRGFVAKSNRLGSLLMDRRFPV